MVDVAIEQLVGLCGLSSTAVTTLARRGIMIRATGAGARGKFVLESSIRSYCAHLREQASGRKAADAPAADRSRLVRAQAQAIETKEAIRRGSLLDSEAVQTEWIGVARTIRAGVLRIPRRAGARLSLSPDQVRELDAEIREVLTDLGTKGS